MKKKNMSKEEKQQLKITTDKEEEKYKTCKINGNVQSVGNYKIEPPGIFLGRGVHPKLGCIKKRIKPEEVIINISKNVNIPEIQKHKWKKVIHDKSVIWLASWKDTINKKTKYIFTSFEGIFKSKSDEKKFDMAKKLGTIINKIRKLYTSQLNDNNSKIKQLATALYLIDKLALRIGNAKDTKHSADTVGVTTLRIEHIKMYDNNIIELNFLGKDSIKYCNKVKIDEIPYNNINEFMKNKNKNEELFDLINPIMMNEYLNNFMKGLTSKVWRTYNASSYFQNELQNINNAIVQKMDKTEKINYLISVFNKANASVATLCNHQKNVKSKVNINKIDEQIKKLIESKKKTTDNKKINIIKNKLIILKLKKELKNKTSNISLGTSKNNYIDPRIFFAFAKNHDIPISKIINNSMFKRFMWASNVDKDYSF
jgi:DNA topoisomerase-1